MQTPTAGATTVVLADDDGRVRDALASLLDGEPDFVVVGQASDGAQAVALTRELAPSLVVTDVRMPGGGPDGVRALVAGRRPPVVVALSASADASTWLEVVRAGASAYLLKGTVGSELPALLRRCLQGELLVGVPGAAAVVRPLLARSGPAR